MNDFNKEQSTEELLYLALKKTESKLSKYHEAMAIIGMSCRFPGGANNLQKYWQLLIDGVDAISNIPPTRWNSEAYYSSDKNNKQTMYTKKAGFLDIDISMFDADLFGISPKEARIMDPQQRLLLEVVWEALEHANIAPMSLKGKKVGVFIGQMNHDYSRLLDRSNAEFDPYYGVGNTSSATAGRVSYALGLEGPCISIDTACSSSLVAMNSALQSIRLGECDMAIVGGVNLILAPEPMINMCQSRMLSYEGHCNTFDEKADGYTRGEGIGVVIIKPLSKAIEEKRTLYALIKGGAVNQNGASSGLTVPKAKAQSTLIQQALENAQIKPNDVDYIEAHGTGTGLGDPIEINGLNEAFSKSGRDKNHPLTVGAVKTNIGHLESCAGIAGIIKTALSVYNKMIPKHLHFKNKNPKIDFDLVPIQVPVDNRVWEAKDNKKRVAGVSSFGFSGINAHVIIEEAPTVALETKQGSLSSNYLFVLSAKTKKSLEALIDSYILYLESTEHPLSDICYTASLGRSHLKFRLALIVDNKNQLLTSLKDRTFNMTQSNILNQPLFSKDIEELKTWYLQGKTIDFETWYAPYKKACSMVDIPMYCFDHQPYWYEDALDSKIEKPAPTTTSIEQPIVKDTQELEYKNSLYLKQLLAATHQDDWETPDTLLVLKEGYYPFDLAMLPDANNSAVTQELWQEALKEKIVGDKNFILMALDGSEDIRTLLMNLITTIKEPEIQSSELQVLCAIYPKDNSLILMNALSGFFKSLYLEAKIQSAKLICFEKTEQDPLHLIKRIEGYSIKDVAVFKVIAKNLYQLKPERIKLEISHLDFFKPESTYLITGGHKGVGAILSEFLASHQKANLILLGRSAIDDEFIKKIKKSGGNCHYYQADVANEASLRSAFVKIKKNHPIINGVFHAAGIIQDELFRNKNVDSFLNVIAPKVMGTLLLNELTSEYPLDFFILFSSIAASRGNTGQTDYAFANGFLADFAEYRNHLVEQKACSGRTLSIEWPYWSEGGMQLSDSNIALIRKKYGLSPLPSCFGLLLLQALSQVNQDRIAVYFGNEHKIMDAALGESKNIVVADNSIIDKKVLTDELTQLCSALVAKVLGYEQKQLDKSTSLYEYGADSLSKVDIVNSLIQYLPFLQALTLIQMNTIEEMVQFILKNHWNDIETLIQISEDESAPREKALVHSDESHTEKLQEFIHSLLALEEFPILPEQIINEIKKLTTIKLYCDNHQSLWVFLNNKPVNLFNQQLVSDLSAVCKLLSLECFDFIKVIYFSHYSQYFSLGGDRLLFHEFAKGGSSLNHYIDAVKQLIDFMMGDRLLISVVDGSAQGGGFELVLNTDLQFVSRAIKLGTPEILSGLYAGMGGVSYLATIAPKDLFIRLSLQGELISSEEAYAAKLITHLCDNPFIEAYQFVKQLPDIDLAIRINSITRKAKKSLVLADLDGWTNYIKSGDITKKLDKIKSDYLLFTSKN